MVNDPEKATPRNNLIKRWRVSARPQTLGGQDVAEKSVRGAVWARCVGGSETSTAFLQTEGGSWPDGLGPQQEGEVENNFGAEIKRDWRVVSI